jgi:hypothetical protein
LTSPSADDSCDISPESEFCTGAGAPPLDSSEPAPEEHPARAITAASSAVVGRRMRLMSLKVVFARVGIYPTFLTIRASLPDARCEELGRMMKAR